MPGAIECIVAQLCISSLEACLPDTPEIWRSQLLSCKKNHHACKMSTENVPHRHHFQDLKLNLTSKISTHPPFWARNLLLKDLNRPTESRLTAFIHHALSSVPVL